MSNVSLFIVTRSHSTLCRSSSFDGNGLCFYPGRLLSITYKPVLSVLEKGSIVIKKLHFTFECSYCNELQKRPLQEIVRFSRNNTLG